MNSLKKTLAALGLVVLVACNPDPEKVAPSITTALEQAYSDTQALQSKVSDIDVDTAAGIIATIHQEGFIKTTSTDHALIQILATLADADNALTSAGQSVPSVKKLITETASFVRKAKEIQGWDWEIEAEMSVANNPVYHDSGNQGQNPLYEGKSALRIFKGNPHTISGSCDADLGALTVTFTNPVTGASIVSKPTSSQFSTLIDSMINLSDDSTLLLISIKMAPLNNGLEGSRFLNCSFRAEQSSAGGATGGSSQSGSPLTLSQQKEIQAHKANVQSLDLEYAKAVQAIEATIHASTDSLETKQKNLNLVVQANNAWVRSTHAHKTVLVISNVGRISPEIMDIASMNLATDEAIVNATTSQLARENVMFSSISNVLKSRHDAVKSVLNIIR